jgi:hypothetical protein
MIFFFSQNFPLIKVKFCLWFGAALSMAASKDTAGQLHGLPPSSAF